MSYTTFEHTRARVHVPILVGTLAAVCLTQLIPFLVPWQLSVPISLGLVGTLGAFCALQVPPALR